MGSLNPILTFERVGDAVTASEALGLAGSSVLTGFLQRSNAHQLTRRLDAAITRRADLYRRAAGAWLTETQHADCDAVEAEIEASQRELRQMVAGALGISFDDLVRVL